MFKVVFAVPLLKKQNRRFFTTAPGLVFRRLPLPRSQRRRLSPFLAPRASPIALRFLYGVFAALQNGKPVFCPLAQNDLGLHIVSIRTPRPFKIPPAYYFEVYTQYRHSARDFLKNLPTQPPRRPLSCATCSKSGSCNAPLAPPVLDLFPLFPFPDDFRPLRRLYPINKSGIRRFLR